MMFVSIMSWKPEDSEKITELFVKWKRPEGLKFLHGPYTMLGQSKSLSILECTDEAWAKVDRYWRKTCTWETYPIMDSSDIVKIKA